MKTIAVIEDDIYIGDLLQETLSAEGYSVIRAYSGTEALLLLEKRRPDLILLDLMLPGLSGEELLPILKGIPVIIVSAKADVNDKATLLLEGAADYITKPFEIRELLARITVQLRRQPALYDTCIRVGELCLDNRDRSCTLSGQPIHLTRTEFAILKLLAENANHVISKSALLDQISLDTPDCTESSLKVHISNLRQKLKSISGENYIEAVWGDRLYTFFTFFLTGIFILMLYTPFSDEDMIAALPLSFHCQAAKQSVRMEDFMEYVLTTNSLHKKYRHFTALDNVSMHVPKGAIYGFVGENGAGKTTLIRLICGLQKPTAGDYSLFGLSCRDPRIGKSRSRMGAVVETPSIYLEMSADDNLKEQYRLLGIPSFDTIPALLKLVGLEDTGKKKAKNFSLGMRQRLGIALALAGNPDFLVLDEPVNGLDPQGIIEIRELILKLNMESGITILISSHILEELSKLATHYGFIHKGRIVQEISAAELEASCRRSLCVTVSDSKAVAVAMEEKGLEYQILSDTQAEIYDDITITELVDALSPRECIVYSASAREEGLENYYMNLIAGKTERHGDHYE